MQQCHERLWWFQNRQYWCSHAKGLLQGQVHRHQPHYSGRTFLLGCQQCQELEVITANVDEVNTTALMKSPPKNVSTAEASAQQYHLEKCIILEQYQDC